MTTRHFQEVIPISRNEAEEAFLSDSPERICNALLRISFNEPDWRWVQEKCLQFLSSKDSNVRGLAVTCLGHLARIHKQLDLHKILPVLENLRHEPRIRGRVEDTLDDIETFIK